FSVVPLPTISALVSLGILTISVDFFSGLIDNTIIVSLRCPPPLAALLASESTPNKAIVNGSPLLRLASFSLKDDLSLSNGLCIAPPTENILKPKYTTAKIAKINNKPKNHNNTFAGNTIFFLLYSLERFTFFILHSIFDFLFQLIIDYIVKLFNEHGA